MKLHHALSAFLLKGSKGTLISHLVWKKYTIYLVGFFCLTIASAQNYAGTYIGVENPANGLELVFDGSVYSGVVSFGTDFVYLLGERVGTGLEGILTFSPGETVDGVFTAAQKGDQILFVYGFTNAENSIDEDTVLTVVFTKENAEAQNGNLSSEGMASEDVAAKDVAAKDVAAKDVPAEPLAQTPSGTQALSGEAIQYGVLYPAGSGLKSDLVGLSFTVPVAGEAAASPAQGFVFGHTGLLGGGVQLIALSSGKLTAIVDDLLSVDSDQQLIPLGDTQQTATRFSASFQLLAEGRTAYKEMRVQQASSGQIVVLVATAFPQEAQQVHSFLDDIEASFSFATPDLSRLGPESNFADSHFSAASSGSTDKDVVSGSNFSLDLCSSREYRVFEASLFSVTAEFDDNSTNMSSSSQGESFGHWTLGAHLMDAALLLNAQDGGFEYYEVLNAQGRLYLNNKPVAVHPSQLCR